MRTGSTHRWRQLRARVLAEETDCALCGQPVDKELRTPHPGSPEVDHVVPVIKGGAMYDRTNVALSHRRCNRAKWKGEGPKPRPMTVVKTSRSW